MNNYKKYHKKIILKLWYLIRYRPEDVNNTIK